MLCGLPSCPSWKNGQTLLDIYTAAAQHHGITKGRVVVIKAVGANLGCTVLQLEIPTEARAYAGIHTQPVMLMHNACLNAWMDTGFEEPNEYR